MGRWFLKLELPSDFLDTLPVFSDAIGLKCGQNLNLGDQIALAHQNGINGLILFCPHDMLHFHGLNCDNGTPFSPRLVPV